MALFGSRKNEDPSALLQRGDYSGAAALLRKRLRAAPDNLHMRNQLGDALAAAGKVKEALAQYQQVAEGHAASGFTAKALAIWKKMSRLAPDDEELLERIAAISRPAAERAAAVQPAPEAPQAPETPAVPESPLFPDFTAQEFAEVARLMEHRRFQGDERIVSEGEPGESLFVIAEGTVRVTVRQEDGDLEVARLGPGDFFGEVAVLTNKTRTATIQACEPCEVLELSGQDLDQIVARHPRVREVMEDFNEKRADQTVEAIVEARLGGAL